MIIVLSLYFLVVWLVFIKFKWLPWNRGWKTLVFSIAAFVALVVLGALKYYTPVSSGAVVQGDTQQIFPLVSGQVVSVSVADTVAVEAGDELFRLDPDPFQFALDARKAELKLAQQRLRDMQTLVEKDAAAAARLYELEASLDLARAKLDQAEYDMEHSVVRAPATGSVSMVALREGEVVGAMTPVMNFIGDDRVTLAAAFAQNGMALMAPGAHATVLFSAAPGVIYETTVANVPFASVQGQLTAQDVADPAAAILSTTGLYPVLLNFPEDAPDYLRRPGTEASITVFADEGNPINALASIIQWIGSKLAYL
ncbi:MAG: HlyD family efflux transporter periplasmic adaptor subunit [Halieaceae bacterium]